MDNEEVLPAHGPPVKTTRNGLLPLGDSGSFDTSLLSLIVNEFCCSSRAKRFCKKNSREIFGQEGDRNHS